MRYCHLDINKWWQLQMCILIVVCALCIDLRLSFALSHNTHTLHLHEVHAQQHNEYSHFIPQYNKSTNIVPTPIQIENTSSANRMWIVNRATVQHSLLRLQICTLPSIKKQSETFYFVVHIVYVSVFIIFSNVFSFRFQEYSNAKRFINYKNLKGKEIDWKITSERK